MNERIAKSLSRAHLHDETLMGPLRKLLMGLAHVICPDGELEKWVFRGVSNTKHRLEPAIARLARAPNDIYDLERRAFTKFRQRALTRLGAENILYLNEAISQMNGKFQGSPIKPEGYCQSQGEAYVWTALMQHSGLPTRLLDWTESPWIALYFASISSEDDEHGMLYALNREELEETHNSRSISPIPLLTRVTRPSNDLIQVAALPYAFGRIEHQLGLFTVSENPGADHAPLIRRRIRNKRAFIFWRVPAQSKAVLRRYLASMNITSSILFPELQGLAESVRGEL
jgi:hypothetical protein